MSEPAQTSSSDLTKKKSQQRSKKLKDSSSDIPDNKAVKRILAPFLQTIRRKHIKKHAVREEFHKFYLQKKPSEVLAKLATFFTDSLQLPTVLNETGEILKKVVKAKGYCLYIVDQACNEILVHPKYLQNNPRHETRFNIESGTNLAAHVAFMREYVMLEDILGDPRFPQGIPGTDTLVKSVLCVPVLTSADSTCIAVIEFYRDLNQESFTDIDLQITVAVVGWMGAAIHQNNERLALLKQSELNDYLLAVTQLFFSGAITFDKIISDIVIFAKTCVSAERGSFYVVDAIGENEVICDVYEEGIETERDILMHKKKMKTKFIRDGPGVPGFVVRSGESVNIHDAYTDRRFNQESDLGDFLTRSIVCVPIKSNDQVLGTLQLVNKLNAPYFTHADESLLQTFTVYSTLATYFERICSQLAETKNKCNMLLGMVEQHIRPCPDDLHHLKHYPSLAEHEMPEGFFGFEWFMSGFEDQLPQFTLFIFNHIIDEPFCDLENLCNFILMVRKSYRSNPYHNFAHGFTVFHCMYNILLRNKGLFTRNEKIALLIAALCHDVDHFGVTNNFLQMRKHWLAQLYPESSLEHHHFYVCILLTQYSNLFKNLDVSDVKEIISDIQHIILATDLAFFLRNRLAIVNHINNGTLHIGDEEQRRLIKGIMITCCDLSGQCKPFTVARKVTESLYREFYKQGDSEKESGLVPLSMMDREKMQLIPDDQIQFLNILCIPCMEILGNIFPNTVDLLTQIKELKDRWKDIVETRGVDVWRPEESIPKEKKLRSHVPQMGSLHSSSIIT